MKQPKILTAFRISDTAKDMLRERSTEEKRSMSAHVEFLVEQDYNSRGTLRIPVYKTITPETLEKAD